MFLYLVNLSLKFVVCFIIFILPFFKKITFLYNFFFNIFSKFGQKLTWKNPRRQKFNKKNYFSVLIFILILCRKSIEILSKNAKKELPKFEFWIKFRQSKIEILGNDRNLTNRTFRKFRNMRAFEFFNYWPNYLLNQTLVVPKFRNYKIVTIN